MHIDIEVFDESGKKFVTFSTENSTGETYPFESTQHLSRIVGDYVSEHCNLDDLTDEKTCQGADFRKRYEETAEGYADKMDQF